MQGSPLIDTFQAPLSPSIELALCAFIACVRNRRPAFQSHASYLQFMLNANDVMISTKERLVYI